MTVAISIDVVPGDTPKATINLSYGTSETRQVTWEFTGSEPVDGPGDRAIDWYRRIATDSHGHRVAVYRETSDGVLHALQREVDAYLHSILMTVLAVDAADAKADR